MRIPVISATQSGGMAATRSGKPARVGAERRWALDYLSHTGGGVKAARVFRREPPVSVT